MTPARTDATRRQGDRYMQPSRLRSLLFVPRVSALSLIILGLAWGGFSTARAVDFSASQKAEKKSFVKTYLMANPEGLREVVAGPEQRQSKRATEWRQNVVGDQPGKL